MSQDTATKKKERGRAVRTGCLFAAALCLSVTNWWTERIPPRPNFSGYYEGDWVNKRGELVSSHGVILRPAPSGMHPIHLPHAR